MLAVPSEVLLKLYLPHGLSYNAISMLKFLGIDQYGFFRADADTDFFPSPLADEQLWTADFLEPIFGADTAFAPSIYIKRK